MVEIENAFMQDSHFVSDILNFRWKRPLTGNPIRTDGILAWQKSQVGCGNLGDPIPHKRTNGIQIVILGSQVDIDE